MECSDDDAKYVWFDDSEDARDITLNDVFEVIKVDQQFFF